MNVIWMTLCSFNIQHAMQNIYIVIRQSVLRMILLLLYGKLASVFFIKRDKSRTKAFHEATHSDLIGLNQW